MIKLLNLAVVTALVICSASAFGQGPGTQAKNPVDTTKVTDGGDAAKPDQSKAGAAFGQGFLPPNPLQQELSRGPKGDKGEKGDPGTPGLHASHKGVYKQLHYNWHVVGREFVIDKVEQAKSDLRQEFAGTPAKTATSGVAPEETGREGTAMSMQNQDLFTRTFGNGWFVPVLLIFLFVVVIWYAIASIIRLHHQNSGYVPYQHGPGALGVVGNNAQGAITAAQFRVADIGGLRNAMALPNPQSHRGRAGFIQPLPGGGYAHENHEWGDVILAEPTVVVVAGGGVNRPPAEPNAAALQRGVTNVVYVASPNAQPAPPATPPAPAAPQQAAPAAPAPPAPPANPNPPQGRRRSGGGGAQAPNP